MASVKMIKKDIDYLVSEVVSDCFMTIFFHPERKEEVVKIMEDTVLFRNGIVAKINSPAEKNNPSLVRKHYAHVRLEMMTGIDQLFERLSSLVKK